MSALLQHSRGSTGGHGSAYNAQNCGARGSISTSPPFRKMRLQESTEFKPDEGSMK